MGESLAALRKARGLSQEQLGKAVAGRLERPIGSSYAQKKIARFESGAAAPADDELQPMADELGVEVERLKLLFTVRAPMEGESVISQLGANGRRLISSCLLSRPRPRTLDETAAAVKGAIEQKNLKIAVFIPYPSVANLSQASDHINDLVFGYYARIRRSISEANLSFKKSLPAELSETVALYAPKAEVPSASVVLIPPIFRQYSLTVQLQPNGDIVKGLHVWTPGVDADEVRPVRATGVFSVEEQIDAWQAFFGEILTHWIEKDEFLPADAYWARVR